MCTQASIYTVFNNIIGDFMEEMIGRFPNNRELVACRTFHNMASKANIKLPYEKFREFVVVPYGDRLASHDDAFFMEKEYINDASGQDALGLIDALKKLWRHMSQEERESVHAYIDLLVDIDKKLSGAAV